MYERLLDKAIFPSFDDLVAYGAESGVLWLGLDKHMRDVFSRLQHHISPKSGGILLPKNILRK